VELELLLYEATAAKTLAEDSLKKKHAAWDEGHHKLQEDIETLQRDLTSDGGGGDLRILLEQQVSARSFLASICCVLHLRFVWSPSLTFFGG
jgi:hypothetical protein